MQSLAGAATTSLWVQTSTSGYAFPLVLSPYALLEGTTYTFQLTAMQNGLIGKPSSSRRLVGLMRLLSRWEPLSREHSSSRSETFQALVGRTTSLAECTLAGRSPLSL